MITLGARVKDSLTGFTGIAMGRAVYLYGCVRILIEPEGLHDGKPIEGQWFDEPRVVEIKPEVIQGRPGPSGGPQNDPRRASWRP